FLASAVKDACRRQFIHAVAEERGVRLAIAIEIADGEEGPVLVARELPGGSLGERAVHTPIQLPVGGEQVVSEYAEIGVRAIDLRHEFSQCPFAFHKVQTVKTAETARNQRRVVEEAQVVAVSQIQRMHREVWKRTAWLQESGRLAGHEDMGTFLRHGHTNLV